MKKFLFVFLTAFFLAFGMPVFAQSPSPVAVTSSRSPQFFSDDMIRISEDVDGSVFAAGRDITVESTINGDLVVAGGTVVIRGDVNQDIYAAAGTIIVEGKVYGVLTAAAGEIRVTPSGYVRNAALLAGSKVDIQGVVDGRSWLAGEHIHLLGKLNQSVQVLGEHLKVGPAATIAGQLSGEVAEPAEIASTGAVVGGVNIQVKEREQHEEAITAAVIFGQFVWRFLSLGALTGVLILFFPRVAENVSQELNKNALRSLLHGVMWMVLTPLIILILIGFLVTWQIALLLFLVYVLSLLLGGSVVSLWVGSKIIRRSSSWLVAASGVAIVSLITVIPVLGWFASGLIAAMGAGTLVSLAWKSREVSVKKKRA